MLEFKSVYVIASMVLVITCCQPVMAAGNLFKGKTLTVIVPYGPGGGFDTWARSIAPYLKKI